MNGWNEQLFQMCMWDYILQILHKNMAVQWQQMCWVESESTNRYSIISFYSQFTDFYSRVFKQWADHASPSNLMAYLFWRDCLQQSLQLGMAGAWDYDHPDLLNMLLRISKKCPSLISSFALFHEEKRDIASHEKLYFHVFGTKNNWDCVLEQFNISGPYSINLMRQLQHGYMRMGNTSVTVTDMDDIQLFPSIAFDDLWVILVIRW